MVAAASLLTAIAAPEPDPVGPAVVDTTQTFEDANGNGIDDDCEDAVVADEAAAAAADSAADLNGDGTVSVSEAAHSDRVGGTNCNHGGYVSQVAHDTCDAGTDTGTTTNAVETSAEGTDESGSGETEDAEAPDADCAPAEDATTTQDTEDAPAAPDTAPTCDTAPTTGDTTPTDTETTDTPKNHGEVVSKVAQSDAVGGKNCNHGGAVSEASHKDNEARKAARDAAKAARDAARATKHAGKGKGH
jgi:hypothetical protein